MKALFLNRKISNTQALMLHLLPFVIAFAVFMFLLALTVKEMFTKGATHSEVLIPLYGAHLMRKTKKVRQVITFFKRKVFVTKN